MRALAVTTPERVAAAPDLPTVKESGVPDYEVTNWHGLIGPKGLPRPVVERLNADMNRLLKSKDAEERLQDRRRIARGRHARAVATRRSAGSWTSGGWWWSGRG